MIYKDIRFSIHPFILKLYHANEAATRMKDRILKIIEAAQRESSYSEFSRDFIDWYNVELEAIRDKLLNEPSYSIVKSDLRKLIILDSSEIEKEMSPVGFWERLRINRLMGRYIEIFSTQQLPLRKYPFINHFILEVILSKVKDVDRNSDPRM